MLGKIHVALHTRTGFSVINGGMMKQKSNSRKILGHHAARFVGVNITLYK
jgi:hypothetical protein